MNDELDKLTDAELSEVFAVEVAGWEKTPPTLVPHKGRGHSLHVWKNAHGNWMYDAIFATDANAVLPWLEKYAPFAERSRMDDGIWIWKVCVWINAPCMGTDGRATTFPRAACLALIRAKRAEKQQQGETP